MIQSGEYLEKPIIKYLDSLLFCAGIPETDSHSVAIKEVIQPVLAITIALLTGIEGLI